MRSRNDEEKLQRREAILDASFEIFFQKGFEKASFDEIAKKAKLSRSLIYVYFKDKNDIHMGLCIRAGQILFNTMKECLSQETDGINQVHAIGKAYYMFYKTEPFLFKLLSMRMSMPEGRVSASLDFISSQNEMQALEDRIMQQMMGAIRLGLEDGTVEKSKIKSPMQTAMFMRGAMHGLIMLQDSAGSDLFDRSELDREELIDYARNFVTSALKV